MPYFALATFAGLRPAINGGEITRIANLEHIDRIVDLKAGVIRITPELAKTKDVRQVMIQPWLCAGDAENITGEQGNQYHQHAGTGAELVIVCPV